MMPTAIAAYLALFATVGFVFVFAALLLGWFFRPRSPSRLKSEIYECGEPAIGLGTVQFNLRFYVVALIFIIFEVEVAFFYPAATIFGWAAQSRAACSTVASGRVIAGGDSAVLPPGRATVEGDHVSSGGRVEKDIGLSSGPAALTPESARTLALMSMCDIGAFFIVLLVGFAYVWKKGDLDWIRTVRPSSELSAVAAIEAVPGEEP